MDGDTRSFLINITASLTIITLTAIVSKLARVVPARRLWRLSDPRSLHICISTSAKTDTGEYIRFSSGLGQIRALALIAPSLHRAYKGFDVQRVLLSEDEIADRYEGDLIILGGPKNNIAAKEIMSLLEQRLPGSLIEPKVIWTADGKSVEYAAICTGDDLKEDYGIVIRATNPYNSKRKVFVFAGGHTYGTTAAARFFTAEFAKLRYAYLGDFMAVVTAKVTDRHVSEPKLLHLKRLAKPTNP
jgi:hypothetical protein